MHVYKHFYCRKNIVVKFWTTNTVKEHAGYVLSCTVYHRSILTSGTKERSGTKRMILLPSQELVLKQSFKINSYPDKFVLEQLARKTTMNEKQIYDWFRRQRFKLRQTECELALSTGWYTMFCLWVWRVPNCMSPVV